MSSLRLALKQSLQETGHLAPTKKERKKKSLSSAKKRGRPRQSGDPPRKRGRPPKHPRPKGINPSEPSSEPSPKEVSKERYETEDRRRQEEEDEEEHSSENEFSYDSEEEEESDNEEEDTDQEDDEEGEQEADDDEEKEEHGRDNEGSRHEDDESDDMQREMKKSKIRNEEMTASDEERRKHRKLLKKQLKHSAAKKIQSQWKRSKQMAQYRQISSSTSEKASAADFTTSEKIIKKPPSSPERESTEATFSSDVVDVEKKKKRKSGTVPPPIPEILEWSKSLVEKKCRKHVSKGMRVKVRFATKVKREGKVVKKKIWYGGRVSAASKDGSKIKIKYDDGTSEISRFPDKDMVVDEMDNGQHLDAVLFAAKKFVPPSLRGERVDEMEVNFEEDEQQQEPPAAASDKMEIQDKMETQVAEKMPVNPVAIESTNFVMKSPSTEQTEVADSNVEEDSLKLTGAKDRSKSPIPAPNTSNLKATEESAPIARTTISEEKANQIDREHLELEQTVKAATEVKPSEDKIEPSSTVETEALPTKDKVEDSSLQPILREGEKAISDLPEGQKNPGATVTEETEQPVKKDLSAIDTTILQETGESMGTVNRIKSEIATQTTVETNKAEGPSAVPSKPSLKIRISKVNSEDRASTPRKTKQIKVVETPEYSSEEELHADTPVTERKVKSIKLKRRDDKAKRRRSIEGSPESPRGKKRKANIASAPSEEGVITKKSKPDYVAEDQKEQSDDILSKEMSSKKIFISLKSSGSEDLLSASALNKMNMKKDRENSPVPRGRKSPISPVRSDSPKPMSKDLETEEGDSSIVEPISKEASKDSTDIAFADPEKNSKALLGSKNSAFGRKPNSGEEVLQPEEEGGLARSNESTDSLPRTGRKAAQEAKEKINSKQNPDKEGRKKKKRKRKDDSDGEDSDEDDRQWVQCDKCKKWRILPSRLQASSLPDKWFCNLNSQDPKHNDCSAQEQTVKQVAKEWRKARKRIKQQRLEQAALEASQKERKDKKSPTNSPKLTKVTRKGGDTDSKRLSPTGSDNNAPPAELRSVPVVRIEKRGRKPKKEKEKEKKDTKPDDSASGNVPTETTPKKPGRKRGRPARNQNAEAARAAAQEKKDDDNVEWVQCEKCEKWRKLPPYMSSDELPDSWYCSMNTWNPESARCEEPEDKADAHHQEVGAFGNFSQGHAGKYSYRSMIFGTGRKQNRPMSEKSRAAESLFMRPVDDGENPHPAVMYSKSSMFLPKTSNFNKTQIVEEPKVSIFEVLSDSDLWAELRGVGQPMEVFSDGSIGTLSQKFLSFETLSDAMKQTMREVVLSILGLYVLTGEEIVNEAQQFSWESFPNGLSQIRAYLNADIIINTLLTLVKDGNVEMTCFKDMGKPMTEWIPRYRRVIRSRQNNEIEEAATKSSKSMKISKPWKKRDMENWITGGSTDITTA